MIDQEKVIRGLESILLGRRSDAAVKLIVRDALALLRELIPVEPLHKCVGSGSNTLIADASYAYCPFCGRRIERHD